MSLVELDKDHLRAVEMALKEFTYGDLITMEWLYESFGVVLPDVGTKAEFNEITFRFLSAMDQFRNVLLINHNMYLTNVRSKGYLIAMPANQVDLSMDRFKTKFRKEARKVVEGLTFINEVMLDQDDVRKRDDNLGKIAALSAFSSKRLN